MTELLPSIEDEFNKFKEGIQGKNRIIHEDEINHRFTALTETCIKLAKNAMPGDIKAKGENAQEYLTFIYDQTNELDDRCRDAIGDL